MIGYIRGCGVSEGAVPRARAARPGVVTWFLYRARPPPSLSREGNRGAPLGSWGGVGGAFASFADLASWREPGSLDVENGENKARMSMKTKDRRRIQPPESRPYPRRGTVDSPPRSRRDQGWLDAPPAAKCHREELRPGGARRVGVAGDNMSLRLSPSATTFWCPPKKTTICSVFLLDFLFSRVLSWPGCARRGERSVEPDDSDVLSGLRLAKVHKLAELFKEAIHGGERRRHRGGKSCDFGPGA